MGANDLSDQQLLKIFRKMLLIRRFEEAVIELHQEEEFRSHYHLYIGQEATGSAFMEVLGDGDRIATTHRNHGHIIARGSDPGRALAEIIGRETGTNGGRGGTLHICDAAQGFLSTSAVVGGCIGLATGAAYALKRAGQGDVAVAFFGDGSLEEGISFEALNIAALWSLPIIFVCENNSGGAPGVAAGGYPSSTIAAQELTGIPASLGIANTLVDGRDVGAVYAVASAAVAACRAGNGPYFIEAATERWPGSRPLWPAPLTGVTDLAMAWGENTDFGEYEEWFRDDDPILGLARELLDQGKARQEELAVIDREVSAEIGAAATFARQSARADTASVLSGAFA